MTIFLSYASEDTTIAEEIRHVLVAEGHLVFFADIDIRKGEAPHRQIRDEIKRCDYFLFLISPHSVGENRYPQTELDMAMKQPHPPKLIPVMVTATKLASIPPVLRATTILRPRGDIAASVAHALAEAGHGSHSVRIALLAIALLMVIVAFQSCTSPGYLRHILAATALPRLVVYSGQTGSAYNQIGAFLLNSLDKSGLDKNFTLEIQETNGSVDNCEALSTGGDAIKIALLQLAAYRNHNECNKTELVYIAPLYHEITHLAVRKELFETINAIKKDTVVLTPCLLYKLGIPIAAGKPGSMTRLFVDDLFSHCGHKANVAPLSDLGFGDAIDEVIKADGVVRAAFFNQAAASALVRKSVENGDACLLPLIGKEVDTTVLALDLKKTSPFNNPEVAEFYRDFTCGAMPFSAFSQVSVVAMRADQAKNMDPRLFQAILEAIYGAGHKQLLEFAPDAFNCNQATKTMGLIETFQYANLKIHGEASKYFKSNCQ